MSIIGVTMECQRMRAALMAPTYTFSDRCSVMGMSREMTDTALEKGLVDVERAMAVCESPIERMMVSPLVFADWHGFLTVPAPIYLENSSEPAPAGDILIVPQMKFMRYRADIGIICRTDSAMKIFFVECDGREFHMDQRQDQERDNYLKALGVTLIRLTGAQIYASPAACMQRVVFVVTAWKADQV